MATVRFHDATRIHPRASRPAVDHLNLEVEDGEFLVLVGPSGCGKTTSLRMLAGLEEIDEGSIYIDDVEISNVPPRQRDIAMVFQNYALYPHMTVAENMSFALRISRIEKREIEERVRNAAKILDLEEYLARRPGQLSGGQRQRVAMGRAIVREPRVFLMDEPLSNLDAQLRVSTRSQIAALQRRLGVTTLYVTHDQVEAMTMGDRVAVLRDGVLQQCDTPRELFEKPANSFVAGFIGSPAMNLLPAELTAEGVTFGAAVAPLAPSIREALNGGRRRTVTVGFRPESVELVDDGHGFAAVVGLVEELGSEAFVYAQLGARADHSVTAESDVIVRVDSKAQPPIGSLISLRIKEDGLLLFDDQTGVRIAP